MAPVPRKDNEKIKNRIYGDTRICCWHFGLHTEEQI